MSHSGTLMTHVCCAITNLKSGIAQACRQDEHASQYNMQYCAIMTKYIIIHSVIEWLSNTTHQHAGMVQYNSAQ